MSKWDSIDGILTIPTENHPTPVFSEFSAIPTPLSVGFVMSYMRSMSLVSMNIVFKICKCGWVPGPRRGRKPPGQIGLRDPTNLSAGSSVIWFSAFYFLSS